MNIGDRIKELRKDMLQLTLDRFGGKIGLGKSALSAMENNQRGVTDQTILSICREFGVSEEWLRTGRGGPFVEKTRSEQIREYFSRLDSLSENFKDRFADALAALDESDWEIIYELVDRLKKQSDERRAKESGHLLQAAHKRTDVEIPEGVDTSDDEFFD